MPHFFERLDNKDPKFTYLRNGNVVRYDDEAETQSGIKVIKLLLGVEDAEDILPSAKPETVEKSSFMFERHLEDFLITNWERTHLCDRYAIYEVDGQQVGKQYLTDTGPLDILALSKDGTEFLVDELKRDRASDQVVGQTL